MGALRALNIGPEGRYHGPKGPPGLYGGSFGPLWGPFGPLISARRALRAFMGPFGPLWGPFGSLISARRADKTGEGGGLVLSTNNYQKYGCEVWRKRGRMYKRFNILYIGPGGPL